jgi:hypothetical protein
MSTANFIVIQDGSSTISANALLGYPDQVQFPEFGAIDADLGLRPILTFQVKPSGDVTLTITLNGILVLKTGFDNGLDIWRMTSEVVNDNVLQADTNTLIASATGPGVVYFSDLVVWYRK